MAIKLKIKKGDKVVVIAGVNKGNSGIVKSVNQNKNKAIVENVNMVYKHKPDPKDPDSKGRRQIEAPLHLSNLKLLSPKTGDATRVGRRINDEGKIERYAKKTDEILK